MLIALVLASILAVGARIPGTALAESIAGRMLCALGQGVCGEPPELIAEYGPAHAAALRRHAPALAFEGGMATMPVDFRKCRRRDCALQEGRGRVGTNAAGEAPVAFTRVLDCRAEAADLDCPPAGDDGEDAVYLQYWFYYPESRTFRGVPILADSGFHPHDWESYQVRIGADGTAVARASSHRGHNSARSPANWASDIGSETLNSLIEKVGLRPRGGWGEPSGVLFVSAGSHAGNVRGRLPRVTSYSEPEDLHLIPLESIADDIRLPDFDPVSPPWEKGLWRAPETAGTS